MRHKQTFPAKLELSAIPTASAERIEQMLKEAKLLPVVDAAIEIGIRIGARTALRWAIHGRNGGPALTTVRAKGRLHTTVPELCRWLAATATKPAQSGARSAVLDGPSSERILEAFGLGRKCSGEEGKS